MADNQPQASGIQIAVRRNVISGQSSIGITVTDGERTVDITVTPKNAAEIGGILIAHAATANANNVHANQIHRHSPPGGN